MILKQMKPMFNGLGDMSQKDMGKLGKLLMRWLELNNENLDEMKETTDRTSEELEQVKGRFDEYESTIAMMQAFLLENDLFERFLTFSDEVINDFLKDQKPKLYLV